MFDKTEYERKDAKFQREYKRIEPYKKRRELTSDLNLRAEYKKEVIRTYNEVTIFVRDNLPYITLEDQFDVKKDAYARLKKLKECFAALNLEYLFGNNLFDTIDIEKVTEKVEITEVSDDDSITQDSATTSKQSNTQISIVDPIEQDSATTSKQSETEVSVNDSIEKVSGTTSTPADTVIISSSTTENDNSNHIPELIIDNNENDTSITMTQTPKDLITMAHHLINYRYSGDPLALDSFIDAIDVLKDLCENQNKAIMLKFLMSKLDGKAREAITITPETPDDIISQLRSTIKTESSKVIEGRILALRADKTNLTTFAERAEELAEQFRRSLVVEGYSKQKAKELTIEKTTELCRKSARNDTVKAVLAASTFSEPKEVIAKMIVEINNLKSDRNPNTYTHKYNNNNKNGNNHANNRNSRQNNRNYNNNSNNNRNGNRSNNQNGQNNRQNWHNNNNYNNNNNRNGQNNTNNNSRTFTNNNNRRSYDQPVRSFSGNETHPGNGGQTTEYGQ